MEANFWEGDAMKQKSMKRSVFSLERGQGIHSMKVLVRNSIGKAIH